MLVYAVQNSRVSLEWEWHIAYGWHDFCAMYTHQWKPECVVMHLCKHKQYFVTDASKETDCGSFLSETAWSEQSYWPIFKSSFLKESCFFHAIIEMMSLFGYVSKCNTTLNKNLSKLQLLPWPHLVYVCLLGRVLNLAINMPNTGFNLSV